MAALAERSATDADRATVPKHIVAQVVDGKLSTHPRPNPRHATAANWLSEADVSNYRYRDQRNLMLETSSPEGADWRLDGAWSVGDKVGAAPFSVSSFSLADLWPRVRPIGFDESLQAPFIGDR